MRNLFSRFLDTRKLAALILAAAIAAYGVAILTAPPARAGHTADNPYMLTVIQICRTPGAVAGLFAAGKDRQDYWAKHIVAGVCFNIDRPISVRAHGVVGEGVWPSDGLDGQMVIIEVFDTLDQVGYTWMPKIGWKGGNLLNPVGQRV